MRYFNKIPTVRNRGPLRSMREQFALSRQDPTRVSRMISG
jgi:hypothetical protein